MTRWPVSVMMRALVLLTISATAFAGVSRGQRAPDFQVQALKGGTVSLAGLRGKVVLLDFWAQWCEPCKKELPQLEKLAKEFSSRGVAVVSISIDKQRNNAERLATQLGISFPVGLDPTGTVAARYDLPKMPTSYLIDRKGIIRYIHEGFDG